MNNFQNSVRADDIQIGFEYQKLAFLYELVSMDEGQEVGYEVKDDVHLRFRNGYYKLIQTKHSVNVSCVNKASNLTEMDKDLWKTLSNWCNMIYDGQRINETSFYLTTNKAIGPRNVFFKKLDEYQMGKIEFKKFKDYLSKLHEKTEDDKLKEYIKVFMDFEVLEILLKKIYVLPDEDDFIKKIKLRIAKDKVNDNRVDIVFSELYTNLNLDMYERVKNRQEILYTYEEFYEKFGKCWEKGRLELLPIDISEEFDLEADIEKIITEPGNSVFLKQMNDINFIYDEDEIYSYAHAMLSLINLFRFWEKNNLILIKEKNNYFKDAIDQWKVYFKEMRIGIKSEDEEIINNAAVKLLISIQKIMMKINSQDLSSELSQGTFYYLSNIPQIGWRIDWKERYKSEIK